jgi:flagellar biosynthetic protein FliQ
MDASDDITHGQLRIGLYGMETTEVIGIGREAIWTVIYVAGPVLIIALSVGLIIGVFQAATSIQEMTLSFIPKLAALVAALLIFGDWQLTVLSEMFITIFDMIPQIFTR